MKSKSLCFILFFILSRTVFAADWYTWRGPDGNGISPEKGWNPRAIVAPEIVWKKTIGVGFSSVSIKDNRLYTMGSIDRDGKTLDVIYCLNAENGEKIWEYTYACARGDYAGPRATPVIEESLLYTMSQEGHLYCLDPGTGKKIWSRSILKEFGFPQINWALASTPVFYKDLVLINAGRAGIAFNKKNGKMIWNNGTGKAGYATPVFHMQNGVQYAAIFSDPALHMVNAETGKIAWTYPWTDRYEVYAFDPLISGNALFLCSESGEKGSVLLDISAGTPKTLWANREMNVIFGGNILINGFMYGADGSPGRDVRLKCIRYSTGQVMWSQSMEFGTTTAADNKLLYLTENGILHIIEARPDQYNELVQGRIFQKRVCWTAPVLSNGRIYARNNPGEMICLDMKQ